MKVFIAMFILLLNIIYPAIAEDIVALQFCYEDKQLLPYYTGAGSQVANPPGVTIEHLQNSVKQLPQVKLTLQRKPWLRCLQLLQQNKVDALVATYDESRRNFAVFPLDAQSQPNANLALSQHATCLVQQPGKNVLERATEGIVIARPLGYVMPQYPEGVTTVQVQSQQHAFDLVKQGRVDATTTLCEVNQLPLPDNYVYGLQVNYPPLYSTTGYLVFSKGFYQQHTELAASLWQTLQHTRDANRYYQYLLLNDNDITLPTEREN
ncbi:transporter substrate-binding domain-containing protein [Rheinheimera baltica]|uniref:transporter substrate-binding domain-containing protein n=1 Tax=Rheinheimera baltica TaxID=67576 RepID=UPI00273F6067|nr:transporter substrate-binding domain-containing protein [Rheinheimera baltica]MDP5148574.1 amino acid ABC transporter [Rheinheimera baltica]